MNDVAETVVLLCCKLESVVQAQLWSIFFYIEDKVFANSKSYITHMVYKQCIRTLVYSRLGGEVMLNASHMG